MTWLLDLDGVVWLTGQAIEGSAAAIERLRASGQRVVFFTNNSGPSVDDHVEALARLGVDATADDVLTSSQAAALLVEAGSTAAVIGGPGVSEALRDRGVEVVPATASPAAMVVGRTTDFSFDSLTAASAAIRQGARFVATNADATLPTPDGPVPGAGALVAFLHVASGVEPEVAGKPNAAAAALVADRVGRVDVLVGDRPDTDGLFARATKARFALVLSGVTSDADLPVEPRPDLLGANLAAIVDQFLDPDAATPPTSAPSQPPTPDWYPEWMAQRDLLKRYLDAGMAFTSMTKSRAEGIVRELVRAGEIQRDQVQTQVDELIERSRRNTDHLVALVRKEVTSQLADASTTIRDELRALERRLTGASGSEAPAAKTTPAKAAAAKKAAAATAKAGTAGPGKRAATSKTAAPSPEAAMAPAKAAPARKAAPKKSPAKRSPPASPAAESAPAKKASPAKKAPAKRAAPAKKAAPVEAPAPAPVAATDAPPTDASPAADGGTDAS
jgi:HAD superfamily hydrolase (TIGR01450 family)